ncbi:hypothetical protein MalM25_04250 [Planctomycetes bacterium MalM25]|nr:hypothetical protein MalM25_04250 [Planctomycetes bacterium MalM25]
MEWCSVIFRTPTRLALLSLAVLGCGGPDYVVAPVTGAVLLDGQPLTGGRISFAPQSSGESVKSGKPGFGDIQPDGSFVVSTYGEQDGAVVGKHRITLINSDPDSPAGKRIGVKRVRIQGFFEVAADQENTIDVELTSADIAKFGQR